jgi:hypothetical protein
MTDRPCANCWDPDEETFLTDRGVPLCAACRDLYEIALEAMSL